MELLCSIWHIDSFSFLKWSFGSSCKISFPPSHLDNSPAILCSLLYLSIWTGSILLKYSLFSLTFLCDCIQNYAFSIIHIPIIPDFHQSHPLPWASDSQLSPPGTSYGMFRKTWPEWIANSLDPHSTTLKCVSRLVIIIRWHHHLAIAPHAWCLFFPPTLPLLHQQVLRWCHNLA